MRQEVIQKKNNEAKKNTSISYIDLRNSKERNTPE